MRDLDRLPTGDNAYASSAPAGMPPDDVDDGPLFDDPSFTDTKAYGMPSLGGEFGTGRVPVLSGPTDGGQADLEAGATYTAPPALVIPTPPLVLPGRSMNATIRTNLYPWFATPKAGLSSNRSSTPPAEEPTGETPEDPPVQASAVNFEDGTASFGIIGRALADAVVHLHYVIEGDLHSITLNINVAQDDTATSIATAIRAALRATGHLAVTGTGGQVSTYGLADVGELTDFEITIERD